MLTDPAGNAGQPRKRSHNRTRTARGEPSGSPSRSSRIQAKTWGRNGDLRLCADDATRAGTLVASPAMSWRGLFENSPSRPDSKRSSTSPSTWWSPVAPSSTRRPETGKVGSPRRSPACPACLGDPPHSNVVILSHMGRRVLGSRAERHGTLASDATMTGAVQRQQFAASSLIDARSALIASRVEPGPLAAISTNASNQNKQ